MEPDRLERAGFRILGMSVTGMLYGFRPLAAYGLSDDQSLRSGFRLCSRLEGRPQKVENRLDQIGISPRASMPVRYTQAKGVSARPTAGVAFHLATPHSSAQRVNGRAYEIVSVHRQSRPVPNVDPVEHINMFIERRFNGRSTGAAASLRETAARWDCVQVYNRTETGSIAAEGSDLSLQQIANSAMG
jgi:hypothetical protein